MQQMGNPRQGQVFADDLVLFPSALTKLDARPVRIVNELP